MAEMQTAHQQLEESLRAYTESALQDADHLLETLKYIGQIADATLQLRSLHDGASPQPVTVASTTSTPHELPATASAELEPVPVPEPVQPLPEAPAPVVIDQMPPATTPPAVTEDAPVVPQLRKVLVVDGREVAVSPRHQLMLRVLESRPSEKIAPAELGAVLPEVTSGARKQAVFHFLKWLKRTELGTRLVSDGATASRRYSLLPEEQPDDSEPAAPTAVAPSRPTPLAMPPRRIEQPPVRPPATRKLTEAVGTPEEVTRTLTDWGLKVHENGTKSVTINGTKAFIPDAGIQMLEVLAEHPEGMVFVELRNALLHQGVQLPNGDLNGLLLTVRNVFENRGYRGQFVDERIVEDGIRLRQVILKGVTPPIGHQEPSFLA